MNKPSPYIVLVVSICFALVACGGPITIRYLKATTKIKKLDGFKIFGKIKEYFGPL